MHDAIPVADAPSSGAVQADGVDFIYKGDGAKLMGQVAHLFQRTHSSCEQKQKNKAGEMTDLFKTDMTVLSYVPVALGNVC